MLKHVPRLFLIAHILSIFLIQTTITSKLDSLVSCHQFLLGKPTKTWYSIAGKKKFYNLQKRLAGSYTQCSFVKQDPTNEKGLTHAPNPALKNLQNAQFQIVPYAKPYQSYSYKREALVGLHRSIPSNHNSSCTELRLGRRQNDLG